MPVKQQRRRRRVLRDNIQGITKGAITRLARKAGIKRLSGLLYEEIRGVLKVHLEEVVRVAVVFAENRRAKRVTGEDVRNAYQYLGHPMVETDFKKVMRREIAQSPGLYKRPVKEGLGSAYSSCGAKPYTGPRKQSPGRKPVRYKPGTQSLREIRFYQKQSSCFSIAAAAFQRLVREIAQDYTDDIQFSEEALHLLQLATENYLIDLLEDANLQSLHAGRVSVRPSDIQIARRVRNER